jgi:hypothetical protein
VGNEKTYTICGTPDYQVTPPVKHGMNEFTI